ncbi:hypothetical protein Tco_0218212 [Tanacetum coccineum]
MELDVVSYGIDNGLEVSSIGRIQGLDTAYWGFLGKALYDALVSPADHLEFGKCNMRLKTDIKLKEAPFQVVLDALALTPFYQAFLITAEVPAIYMQEFWAIISVHKAFATVINKCLSGKEIGMDMIRQRSNLQRSQKPKAKGLAVLSEVALTEAEQLKLATKRSKTQFHSSHVSGSGDGVDTQSKVPDEQQQKTFCADEGTSTIPGVPDVPIYASESDKEYWGDSDEEDNDEDDFEDDVDINDDDSDDNDERKFKFSTNIR